MPTGLVNPARPNEVAAPSRRKRGSMESGSAPHQMRRCREACRNRTVNVKLNRAHVKLNRCNRTHVK